MSIKIEDGDGSGNTVGVNIDHNLKTYAVQDSLMNHLSIESEHQQVFDIEGTLAISSGVTNVSGGVIIYLQNIDPTNLLIVDRIYAQVIDDSKTATLPAPGTYIQVGFGRSWITGGNPILATNENQFSTNTPSFGKPLTNPVNSAGTLLGGPLNLTGTFEESIRFYPDQTGKPFEIEPQGEDSIILTNGQAIEVDLSAGLVDAGTVNAVMRFSMTLPGHYR